MIPVRARVWAILACLLVGLAAFAAPVKVVIMPASNNDWGQLKDESVLDPTYGFERNKYEIWMDALVAEQAKSNEAIEYIPLSTAFGLQNPRLHDAILECLKRPEHYDKAIRIKPLESDPFSHAVYAPKDKPQVNDREPIALLAQLTGAEVVMTPVFWTDTDRQGKQTAGVNCLLTFRTQEDKVASVSGPCRLDEEAFKADVLPYLQAALKTVPNRIPPMQLGYYTKVFDDSQLDDYIDADPEDRDHALALLRCKKFPADLPYWRYQYALGLAMSFSDDGLEASVAPLKKAAELFPRNKYGDMESMPWGAANGGDVLTALADAAYANEDYATAAATFDDLLKQKRSDGGGYINRLDNAVLVLDTYFFNKEYAKIPDLCDDFIKGFRLDRRLVDSKLRAGKEMHDQAVITDAVAQLQTLMDTAFEKGDRDEVLALTDLLIEMNCATAQDYFRRGFTYAKLGNAQEAIAAYRQALTLDPAYAPAYFNLRTILLHAKKHADILTLYTQALAKLTEQKDLARIHYGLGVSYYFAKNYDKAVAEFKTSMALDPARTAMCTESLEACRFVQTKIKMKVDNALTLAQVRKNDLKYKGKVVCWSGVVDLMVENNSGWTNFVLNMGSTSQSVVVSYKGSTKFVEGDEVEFIGPLTGHFHYVVSKREVYDYPKADAVILAKPHDQRVALDE